MLQISIMGSFWQQSLIWLLYLCRPLCSVRNRSEAWGTGDSARGKVIQIWLK